MAFRWAVAYQVCTTCIDLDDDKQYTTVTFYNRVKKHLKNNGFDTRIKYALFACSEGVENTREDAIKAASEIFEMDKSCDHLTSLHVLKIEDYHDLMADFCGCGIDDDTEFLTKQLDAVKKGCG